MPRHIAITGVPGAGKSTICTELVRMNRSGSSVYCTWDAVYTASIRRILPVSLPQPFNRRLIKKNLYRLWYKLTSHSHNYVKKFISQYESLWRKILDYLAKYAPDNQKRCRYESWFRQTAYQYQVIVDCLYSDETFIFDEGFVNRATTVFHPDANVDPEHIRWYTRNIPHPSTVVVVGVDSSTAVSRMRDRNDGPPIEYNKATDEELQMMLDELKTTIRIVVDTLDEEGVDVYRVDNNRDLKSVRSHLRSLPM